ncbi:MAG TPA: DPP IV N-terminal domain-containing protein [Parasegetibacter sp.]
MKRLSILTLSVLLVSLVYSQQPVTKANYDLPSRFSPGKLAKMVHSVSVEPNWLLQSERFWYTYETSEGRNWYIVDPAKATKKLLFDNAEMAAKITRIVKDPFDAQHLGIQNLRFMKDENLIQFEVRSTQDVVKKDSASNTTRRPGGGATPPPTEKKVFLLEYNLTTRELKEVEREKPERRVGWANVAPDSSIVIYIKNDNIWWMDTANLRKAIIKEDDSTIVEHQMTFDGVEFYGYGRSGKRTSTETDRTRNSRRSINVLWSPDSRYFVLTRTDMRKVKDLWVINNLAEPRPTLETYKYHMPGEQDAPIEEMMIFDVASKKGKRVPADMFKHQTLGLWSKPVPAKYKDSTALQSNWLGTKDRFFFSRTSRDLKRIDICVYDVQKDTVIALVEERLNTYVEIQRPVLINDGKEFIHWSERDGWGHYYLYDGNGKLKGQITSGPYHCESVVRVDEKNRVLYFTANGKEPNEDPYLYHLYRVNFDGSGLKLLNPGDYNHVVNMHEDMKYFVDNYSRVNTVPASALFDNTGRKIMDLETADLSQLFAAGYKFPEPFKVKADDGITDLYGVMYKPFDFDSTKKYPIILYVYPGPQTEAVNKGFSTSMDRIDRLAQFGFIVVTVGNRGGHPARSKWYHNYGYGNLRDYGLADKKATVEQLSARHSWIDMNRVGITGHSGGGFMSTAAMLVYPEFFKVAVSSAGNHENNIYNRWWSEKHHGVNEVVNQRGDTIFQYSIDKNSELAKNLKGKLLLVTGDVDNNVHPANTIRMANALIKANKRFDFMIMPGQAHSFGQMTEYFFWLMGDYFCKHLLGDFSQPVDIIEINRENMQLGEKASSRMQNDRMR